MDVLNPSRSNPGTALAGGFDFQKTSLSGKQWILRADDQAHHLAIVRHLGLGDPLAPLLASRSLESAEQVLEYMSPRLQGLVDPARLLDMEPAVERIIQAMEQQQAIAVFGDYDVDGATSSALLDRYFQAVGVRVRVYIPDRLTEGYGPSVQAMQRLAGEGIRLVITVDCGISAFEAIRAAAAEGMDVIVTDHHQPPAEGLPPALAVINPNRPDDTFPHKELAGVGVAFYLVMAMNRRLREMGWFHPSRPEPDLRQLLDLVALGTIADMARLSGMNRVLVHAGIKVAAQGLKPGLRALYQRVGIPLEGLAWSLGVSEVGFQIGPRINAGGRLDRGSLGYELLASDDEQRVTEIAQILDESNQERREIERRIFDDALEIIDRQRLAECRLGMVVARENWHPGVVGIVASRLVERFHRPTVVLSLDKDGRAKGSGRSVAGVDLLGAIQATAELLSTFGGHRAAVGLTLPVERVEAFAQAFDDTLRRLHPAEVFFPKLGVDGFLNLSEVDQRLLFQVQKFQPFGMGNPEPVFVLRRVKIANPRLLKDRHVKCTLTDTRGCRLDAIAFRGWPGPLGEGLMNHGVELDVAGILSMNRYRGEERLQFLVKDARH